MTARNNSPERPFGISQHVVVVVGKTDYGTVMVRDAMGFEHEVPTGFRPKGTASPASQEKWLMERQPGGWRLTTMIGHPEPPAITGSRTGADPLAVQLLAVLAGLGYVTDQTTP